ncbi:flagellar protein FlgN [Clostridium tetani]|uniref:flagellar protein FlgN n=1 Tax=Clostridium tetani TaxID=1513 RepID=UPI00100BD40A|nr:flagellar protein FlgN [Clostridium tetani]RXI45878.1 flagellar protein FlgN [Clostridium tetani]RXM61270.1 flagellar protein FlgN [Clostridium tetani]RXM70095.1 flagellar protein FlgN [Clostridium tetani]RXM74418.1 flagellar protein FlgN [Clostridium tetani]
MTQELNNIILGEIKAFEELLKVLDKQHEYIVKNNIFKMESIVDEIEENSKNIARYEMDRRKITKGRPMTEIIREYRDEELETNYRKARKLLEELNLQKDTNETLLKQGIVYANKMLQIINPNREAKTYSAHGKMK